MGNIWRSRMSRRRLQGKIEQRTSYSKLNWGGTKQFAPLFFYFLSRLMRARRRYSCEPMPVVVCQSQPWY
jgi:hypothetical protein